MNRSFRPLRSIALAAACGTFLTHIAVAQVTFQGLGQLPGGTQTFAHGVSADGSVIVGYGINASSQAEAFRWTSGGGMTGMGFRAGGTMSVAEGISADGSV